MCKVSLLISLRLQPPVILSQLSQSERKGKLRTHRQCVTGLTKENYGQYRITNQPVVHKFGHVHSTQKAPS